MTTVTRVPRPLLAAALVAASLAVAACGSARRGPPIADPMQLNSASLKRGQAIYDTYCFKCHTDGEGGMGPKLNDKPLPRFLMRFQIRHGLGVMPAFSEKEIDDREMEDLLDYLVALRRYGQ